MISCSFKNIKNVKETLKLADMFVTYYSQNNGFVYIQIHLSLVTLMINFKNLVLKHIMAVGSNIFLNINTIICK